MLSEISMVKMGRLIFFWDEETLTYFSKDDTKECDIPPAEVDAYGENDW